MTARDPSAGAEARRAASDRARREREARALRENLLRRKVQARARRDGAPADATSASGPGRDPGGEDA